jgi:hypothetical protein
MARHGTRSASRAISPDRYNIPWHDYRCAPNAATVGVTRTVRWRAVEFNWSSIEGPEEKRQIHTRSRAQGPIRAQAEAEASSEGAGRKAGQEENRESDVRG